MRVIRHPFVFFMVFLGGFLLNRVVSNPIYWVISSLFLAVFGSFTLVVLDHLESVGGVVD